MKNRVVLKLGSCSILLLYGHLGDYFIFCFRNLMHFINQNSKEILKKNLPRVLTWKFLFQSMWSESLSASGQMHTPQRCCWHHGTIAISPSASEAALSPTALQVRGQERCPLAHCSRNNPLGSDPTKQHFKAVGINKHNQLRASILQPWTRVETRAGMHWIPERKTTQACSDVPFRWPDTESGGSGGTEEMCCTLWAGLTCSKSSLAYPNGICPAFNQNRVFSAVIILL